MTDNETPEPEPTDEPTIDAHAEALAAAVPGARGWFRPADGSGAINLRLAGSVQPIASDVGSYRLVVPASGYTLSPGPFTTEQTAADVCDALLRLAYDDAGWPTFTS